MRSPKPEQVTSWLREQYGDESISTDFGDDRSSRIQAIRSYQFRSSLPWLAQIIDRFPDGSVGSHWVMVERVTTQVTCMDPYPWDDLDEEYQSPVVDFMVKWELAGNHCIRWGASASA